MAPLCLLLTFVTSRQGSPVSTSTLAHQCPQSIPCCSLYFLIRARFVPFPHDQVQPGGADQGDGPPAAPAASKADLDQPIPSEPQHVGAKSPMALPIVPFRARRHMHGYRNRKPQRGQSYRLCGGRGSVARQCWAKSLKTRVFPHHGQRFRVRLGIMSHSRGDR